MTYLTNQKDLYEKYYIVDGVTEDIVSMELPKEAYVELYTDSATSRYYMKDIEMIDMAKEEYIAAYPEYFV